MLSRISTRDVEPADLDVPLAPRLNLLAGDNGLGKTFLLDLAWYALSTTWAAHDAMPRRTPGSDPTLQYWLGHSEAVEAKFNFQGPWWQKKWPPGQPGPTLGIYVRADGDILVQDSLRRL